MTDTVHIEHSSGIYMEIPQGMSNRQLLIAFRSIFHMYQQAEAKGETKIIKKKKDGYKK